MQFGSIAAGAISSSRSALPPIRRIERARPEQLTVRLDAGVVNDAVAHECRDIVIPDLCCPSRRGFRLNARTQVCTLDCRKAASVKGAHAYGRYQQSHLES